MLTLESELAVANLPAAQGDEIRRSEFAELVEQLSETLSLTFVNLREAVIRLEAAIRSLVEDDPRARNPVRVLAVNQMPDVVEGAECVRAFVRRRPAFGQTGEKRAKRRRGSLEHGNSIRQFEIH